MKLSTRDTVEAPVAFVYTTLSDFNRWEKSATQRGADVARSDGAPGAPGLRWSVRFAWRGTARSAELILTDAVPDRKLAFSALSDPAAGEMLIDLSEIAPGRTQVAISVEVKPKTLASRLVIQSMRLAKAKMERTFETRVAQIGAMIEDGYRAQGRG